jgi:SAM-dependent methyltransferase
MRLHRIKLALLDARDWVLGRAEPLRPPRHLLATWELDGFDEIGQRFLGHFIEVAGLQPHHAVLDVGCGIGRMAVPLTGYLESGSYDGFDVIPRGIRWCQKHITQRYPKFRFTLADLYNRTYNPRGTSTAADFVFPYENCRFDLVVLTSVFTHLLPRDFENYIGQIARVLKPGGRCFATFFIAADDAEELIAAGRSSILATVDRGSYYAMAGHADEDAVVYKPVYLQQVFERAGLHELAPRRWGRWCGRSAAFDYQDIVLLEKP